MDREEIRTIAKEVAQEVMQTGHSGLTTSGIIGPSIEGGVVHDEGNARKGEENYQNQRAIDLGHHQRLQVLAEAKIADAQFAAHLANLRALDSGIEEASANAITSRLQTGMDTNLVQSNTALQRLVEALVPRILDAVGKAQGGGD